MIIHSCLIIKIIQELIHWIGHRKSVNLMILHLDSSCIFYVGEVFICVHTSLWDRLFIDASLWEGWSVRLSDSLSLHWSIGNHFFLPFYQDTSLFVPKLVYKTQEFAWKYISSSVYQVKALSAPYSVEQVSIIHLFIIICKVGSKLHKFFLDRGLN